MQPRDILFARIVTAFAHYIYRFVKRLAVRGAGCRERKKRRQQQYDQYNIYTLHFHAPVIMLKPL
jgi:hypothetical protein